MDRPTVFFLVLLCVTRRHFCETNSEISSQEPVDGGMMSNSPFNNTSDSPHSLTDADSAIGASTSPDLRQDEFSDEREENFECFGESDAKEHER